MSTKGLLVAAAAGNDAALEALKVSGWNGGLSEQMNDLALETALELFDEFSDELQECELQECEAFEQRAEAA